MVASAAVASLRAYETETGVRDLQIEVLAHLVSVDHRTDGDPDLHAAAQRIALAPASGLHVY